jgi:UDP-glucose 4-epimerase
MSPAGKRIFITGGAGFIGSALTGRLLADNEVVIYDSLSRDALKDKAYSRHDNLTVVRGDVLDAESLGRAMRGANLVVHCAAIAGIDTVTKSPTATLRVNMIGSYNVLAAADDLERCERVVCMSTSEIYGRRAFRAAETDDARVGAAGEPRWAYAVGKLAEEHLAIMYHRENNLASVVLRPFNVYGPGQVGEGAIRNFVLRAIADEPIAIYGDGTQIRSWCYVDDMVDALLLALEHPAAIGESFNIGNETAVATTYELARTCVRVLGSKSQIRLVHRGEADVELRTPCVARARERLGFEAQVGLEEGILRTAEHFGKAVRQ